MDSYSQLQAQAIERLRDAGILLVAAAGNGERAPGLGCAGLLEPQPVAGACCYSECWQAAAGGTPAQLPRQRTGLPLRGLGQPGLPPPACPPFLPCLPAHPASPACPPILPCLPAHPASPACPSSLACPPTPPRLPALPACLPLQSALTWMPRTSAPAPTLPATPWQTSLQCPAPTRRMGWPHLATMAGAWAGRRAGKRVCGAGPGWGLGWSDAAVIVMWALRRALVDLPSSPKPTPSGNAGRLCGHVNHPDQYLCCIPAHACTNPAGSPPHPLTPCPAAPSCTWRPLGWTFGPLISRHPTPTRRCRAPVCRPPSSQAPWPCYGRFAQASAPPPSGARTHYWPAPRPSTSTLVPQASTNRCQLAGYAHHRCLRSTAWPRWLTSCSPLTCPTALPLLPAGKRCWTQLTRWQRCRARSSPAAASTCRQQWRLCRHTRRRRPRRPPHHVRAPALLQGVPQPMHQQAARTAGAPARQWKCIGTASHPHASPRALLCSWIHLPDWGVPLVLNVDSAGVCECQRRPDPLGALRQAVCMSGGRMMWLAGLPGAQRRSRAPLAQRPSGHL